MTFIFWLSSSPDGQGGLWLIDLLPYGDKLAHAAAFGLLAGFFWLALRSFWWPIVLSSLYGLSDELHQRFVPGRQFDLLDLLADITGALLFILLVSFLTRLRTPQPQTLE